jgi:hypothetical protein
MGNEEYSFEDRIETLSGRAVQLPILRSSSEEKAARRDPREEWRRDGLLAGIGEVVAYERADGSMAVSTWDGEDITVWARFDVSPLPRLNSMRRHMVEAVSVELPRPPGFIRVICFTA